ncbi:hypothetical protein Tco_0573460, partial [Tanacetum coccineum]
MLTLSSIIFRHAYTPIVTDIESEPFKDPTKTGETQPLSPRAAPLSPDYTPDSPDYTPDTPHSDEDLEPMKASETRTASPSGYEHVAMDLFETAGNRNGYLRKGRKTKPKRQNRTRNEKA